MKFFKLFFTFLLVLTFFDLSGQSIFNSTQNTTPKGESVSVLNPFAFATVDFTLFGDDVQEGAPQDLFYGAKFLNVLNPNNAVVIPIVASFNTKDINLGDIFAESGVSIGLRPYTVISGADSNPLVLHGVVEFRTDVDSIAPELIDSGLGLEYNIKSNDGQRFSSIGANFKYSQEFGAGDEEGGNESGFGLEIVGVYALSTRVALVARYTTNWSNTLPAGSNGRSQLLFGSAVRLAN